MTADWAPGNEVERAMADALGAGDDRRYARLLQAARLLVPEPPAPGSPEEQRLVGLLPTDTPYVLAFTSLEAMRAVLGDEGRYQELGFAALRQRWPDRHHQLAVSPGTPIATFVPPGVVADIAAGKRSLVPVEEIQRVVSEEALRQIRRLCLTDLTGVPPRDAAGGRSGAAGGSEVASGRGVAAGGLEGPADGGEDPPALVDQLPVNPLETALREAVERQDGDAYLSTLLVADVLVLTTSTEADPGQIHEAGFPWRILGGDQARAIAVFSSAATLARTGARDARSVQVPFLEVLLSWPDEEQMLVVNPGTVTELCLPGSAVLDLVSVVTEALDA